MDDVVDQQRRQQRFHGRVAGAAHLCSVAGCPNAGEFRAPGEAAAGFDGPGRYRWFCLDHVRAFNAGYNWFAGMTQAEIEAAQSPVAGWETESRAFRATGGADLPPAWADFRDPLDAIASRARATRATGNRAGTQTGGRPLSGEDRAAMVTLGLPAHATRRDLRARYSELVRRYHPDRNGGDRSQEARLQGVIEAYQQLRRSPAFA